MVLKTFFFRSWSHQALASKDLVLTRSLAPKCLDLDLKEFNCEELQLK